MRRDSRQSRRDDRYDDRYDNRYDYDDDDWYYDDQPPRKKLPKRQVVRQSNPGGTFLVGFGIVVATLILTVGVILGTSLMASNGMAEIPDEEDMGQVSDDAEESGSQPASDVLAPVTNIDANGQTTGTATAGDIPVTNPTQTFFASKGTLSDASALGYLGEKLADEPKRLYLQLHAAISEGREDVDMIEVYDENSIKVAWETLFDDHPEFFWLNGQYKYYYDPVAHTLSVQFGLCVPIYELSGYRSLIENKAVEFQNSIPADASQYDIALKAYEYIIYNTEYDESAPNNQNILSVFSGGRSVCAGYARAYQYLLHRSGLFCSFVHGTGITESGTTESHAWNLICIDGIYAYVDTTWGDKNPKMVETGQPDWGEIRYAYFGMPTVELAATGHVFLDASLWPPCDSYDLSVYKRQGMLWEGYSRETFHAAIKDRIANGVNTMEFQFTNPDAWNACMADVEAVDERGHSLCLDELPDWMGVHRASWSFLSNDTTRTVRFTWQAD